MPPQTRRLDYQPLASLKPATRNPKGHDIPTIRASLTRFGLVGPAAVVDERTGRMVAGHGRRTALLELQAEGAKPPAGVTAENGDWTVPVGRGWRSKNAKEADAYLLADNETTILGGWERGELDDMLSGLGAGLLEGTGFTLADLPTGPVTDDDFNPEPPAEPVTRPGDRWELGPHLLVCGDATDPACYPTNADMVWTDPPYGVDYIGKTADALTISGDTAQGLEGLLGAAFACTFEASKPGAAWWVGAPAGPQHLTFAAALTALQVWRQSLVWVKDRFVLGHSDYHYRHEVMFYGWKPGSPHASVPDRSQDTVWEFPRPGRSTEHPTMKPVPLIARSIANSSQPGELVLDPFAGSGSTLIAAHDLGRRAHLIELDPAYCDVICTRYQRHTSDKPVRNGQPHDFTGS